MDITNPNLLAVTFIVALLAISSPVDSLQSSAPILPIGFGLQVEWSRVIYVVNNCTQCPSSNETLGWSNVHSDNASECGDLASCCQTLEWYSQGDNFNGLLVSNTMVIFMEGSHNLSVRMNVLNINNISMIGDPIANECFPLHPTSWISCKGSDAGVYLSNVSNVRVESLVFNHCQAIQENCHIEISAALSFCRSQNISIYRVIINHTKGFGLYVSNIFGSILIDRSAFVGAVSTANKHAGNVMFQFGHWCHKCDKSGTNLIITNSWIMDGVNAQGLQIVMYCGNISVSINNVTFRNNTGDKGGNIAISVTDFGYVNSSIITIRNSIIEGGRANKGGGIRIWSRTNKTLNHHCQWHHNSYTLLSVRNTTFRFNSAKVSGGATYIAYFPSGGYDCLIRRFWFKNCTFVKNVGNGAVMEATKHQILANHGSPPLSVTFDYCTFRDNFLPRNKKGPIMNLIMTYTLVADSRFIGGNGSAISLRNSKLNFLGNISFENNRAHYGAALKVCEGSLIFLHKHTYVRFINNTARIGGAIFSSQSCVDTAPSCIFQPTLKRNISIEDFHKYLRLEFVNNSAEIAGDVLYGGSIERCYTIGSYYPYHYGHKQSHFYFKQIFNTTFDMKGQSGPSQISSFVYKVCFCDKDRVHHANLLSRDCFTGPKMIQVHPGEKFNISAVTVGQMNGYTYGTLQAALKDESDKHKLFKYNLGNPSNHCIPLTLSLSSNRKRAIVGLYATSYVYRHFYTNFSVSFLPCPLGFQFDKNNSVCSCNKAFFDKIFGDGDANAVHCDINTKTIQLMEKRKSLWFGCMDALLMKNRSKCNTFALSSSCDYYCQYASYNISVVERKFLDDQCVSGRTGILCGQCKPGLSRVLGASSCQKCSNVYLPGLIALYMLPGIFLVIFLTMLNITVTEGTINGIIFYATILHGNRGIILHSRSIGQLNQYLWMFISWLNLYLGFDTCAYDGLDGYQHIWLTFGYTFYLLSVQLFIIFLSRKFILFTRLFGRNVLKVLATLLFLTNSQLLYACFHSFHFAEIYVYTENTSMQTKYVWHYDGNVPYLSFKHALLLLMAVICFCAMLCFMLSLFMIQCLQRWTDYWYLKWVERLRPFYEAYTGPCNDNYRFWPGLLYLLRSALYALDLWSTSFEYHIKHLKMIATASACVLVLLLAILFPHGVYKKWYLNILEFSLFLNLCITCIVWGFTRRSHHVVSVSILIVMLTCFGVLLYHIYQRIKVTYGWSKLISWLKKLSLRQKIPTRKREKAYHKESDSESAPFLPQPLPSVINGSGSYEPFFEE